MRAHRAEPAGATQTISVVRPICRAAPRFGGPLRVVPLDLVLVASLLEGGLAAVKDSAGVFTHTA